MTLQDHYRSGSRDALTRFKLGQGQVPSPASVSGAAQPAGMAGAAPSMTGSTPRNATPTVSPMAPQAPKAAVL